MKKNRLLDVAAFACKMFCLIQLGVILLISIILVHWHINREYYSEITFKTGFPVQSTFGYSVTRSWTSETSQAPLTLSNVEPASLYFSYIQLSMILLLVVLTMKEFLKIIRSVKLVQTFRRTNVESFRRIGKYFLLIFVLTSFSIVIFEQGFFYGFSLSFTPLILMLIAYILAEIFEQGNELSEENQLTI